MRPFYGEFAWAYDQLIDRPVRAEAEQVVRALARHGAPAPARVLDAGCGTGRYAIELARSGYEVTGIDRAPAMIDEARKAAAAQSLEGVSFEVRDLLGPAQPGSYDAVLCRGVLNDLLDERERGAAFAAFARALRDGGILLFDVRDWDASVTRKSAQPVLEKAVSTARGRLTFRSVTELNPANRALVISERHALDVDGEETTVSFRFIMKCWTRDEVQDRLTRAGFRMLESEAVADRLAVIGSLGATGG